MSRTYGLINGSKPKEAAVIAMIFEFWMTPDDDVVVDYSATSNELRELLDGIDGFGGVERFESCMAEVVRDYGPTDRRSAPSDSNDFHERS